MTIKLAMSRLLYVKMFLVLAFIDGLLSLIEHNMINLLAAAAGALAIRFAWPKMPIRTSIGGWLVGFILACLFGNDAYRNHWFGQREIYAAWGIVALAGDIIIQLIGWGIRLLQPIGKYTIEHPGEAFNNGMERAEQVAGVWMRIKAPVLSLIDFIKSVIPHK
ncbi:hypothetical protein [Fibrella forsythiae]|uniref:Uncharacterized protein n=1 Tax=Fibrella forsythiae TaxID=2817061 RepID=A0ABS3JBC2_9BACT|nr:hypothetical protein [Fibrella forsythiae]MBO0947290.1 hypothetical protein [Fibrella forsythiae]